MQIPSSPRTLAIGDIHGCSVALKSLVEILGISENDSLITLGDLVDRGPDSKGVIDCLIDLDRRCRLISLRGNHEILLLSTLEVATNQAIWAKYGGIETLRSYGVNSVEEIPRTHIEFIWNTRPYYETASQIFAHATLSPDLTLESQTEETLFWDFLRNPLPHFSGKRFICGHTAQKSGLPLDFGHTACIDTWAEGDGWLTCLDVETDEYWQANQKGESREGKLGSLKE